jgi:hypothetical protein
MGSGGSLLNAFLLRCAAALEAGLGQLVAATFRPQTAPTGETDRWATERDDGSAVVFDEGRLQVFRNLNQKTSFNLKRNKKVFLKHFLYF